AEAGYQHCVGPTLVLSTGVIGVPLPIENVLAGIGAAADRLTENDSRVADAILTTDTCRKTTALHVRAHEGGRSFVVGGMAKGSGMIHPNLATMLALIATAAPIYEATLRAIIHHAVDRRSEERQ